MNKIRFGVLPSSNSFKTVEWPSLVKNIENLGYSTILKEDHFQDTRDDPLTLLAIASAHTTNLNIGTAVLCVDFRHPAVIAQAASTLQHQSGGRFELGIGAGWLQADYTQSGIRYDNPATRIERLDEALQVIKKLWTQEKTTFHGKHFTITDMDRMGVLSKDELPKIYVGGGGKRMLSVAGKHADIVGIIPKLDPSWPPKEFHDYSLESIKEKLGWVRDSAAKHGRDPDLIEYALYSPGNVLVSGNTSEFIKTMSRNYQMSETEFLNSPTCLIGTGDEVREKIKNINEETGITYFQFLAGYQANILDQLTSLSKQVVIPLAN